jgi:hypothetical protein
MRTDSPEFRALLVAGSRPGASKKDRVALIKAQLTIQALMAGDPGPSDDYIASMFSRDDPSGLAKRAWPIILPPEIGPQTGV